MPLPNGKLAAHVLGGQFLGRGSGCRIGGVAGVETFDTRLRDPNMSGQPLELFGFVVQSAVEQVFMVGCTVECTGAAAILMDVHTGEVVSIVLPDFDPKINCPRPPVQGQAADSPS